MIILYLLNSTIVLLISFNLFKRAAGTMSLTRLNIVSWLFYLEFFLYSFLGANLSILGVRHYLIDRATMEARYAAYWALCYAMIVTPLTMVFVQRAFLGGKIRKKILSFYNSPLVRTRKPQAFYWIVLSLISLIATIYVYSILQRIPLLYMIRDVAGGFDLLRFEAKFQFPGNEYIKNFLSTFLAPLISYIAFGYYRLYRRPLYLVWFLFCFLISVLAITYSGEKGPIVFYIVSLYFVRFVIEGKASKTEYVFLGFTVIALIAFTYWSFMGRSPSKELLMSILSRISLTQYAGMPLAWNTFPDKIPFLMGGGFPEWITRILDVEHRQMARLLMETYLPYRIAEGAGVINTFFIADAWANFGWPGLLLAPFWVGIVIQIFYNVLVSMPKTPISVGLMGYFLNAFRITGDFLGFLWNPAWIFLIGLVCVSYLINGIKIRRHVQVDTANELTTN